VQDVQTAIQTKGDLVQGGDSGTAEKLAATALGAILYIASTVKAAWLSGNTTSTKKFLTQTGDGSASAAPAWNTLVSSDIPDLGVTTAKIDASAVTTAKIADTNVTTAKLADSSVTTAKIADANVTTAKLADASVTTAKGGTGQNFSSTAQGNTLYFSGTGVVAALAPGTSGQFLKTQGAGANPIWADSSGASAATQAEQETASSTTVFTSPGRQQYHPSAAKVWAYWNMSGTPALKASYNVASITDHGVADQSLNFTVSFSSANYAVVSIGSRSSELAGNNAKTLVPRGGGHAAGSIRLISCDGGSGVDNEQAYAVCYGDQ